MGCLCTNGYPLAASAITHGLLLVTLADCFNCTGSPWVISFNVLASMQTSILPSFDLFSEHCRHWFFKGRVFLDGLEQEKSLFQMVMDTQKSSNQNNVIKFADNSR